MNATTATVNPNPEPKTQFLANETFVKAHLDLIVRPDFDRAIQYSLLQMQLQVSRSIGNPNDALAAAYRMQGALEFVQCIRLLGLAIQVPKVVPNDNLSQS